MSFFGLKYKKVKVENITEVLQHLNLDERSQKLMSTPDSVSSWKRNGDGSIQYTVSSGASTLLDERIALDQEQDYTLPDGTVSKNTFTLEGDVLKAVMKVPGSKTRHFVRTFNGNSMTMEISVEGVDAKATVTYEAV